MLAPINDEGPFTLPHFMRWANRLILDNGDPWEIEQFQYDFLVDVFSGKRECWLIVPEGNGKTTLVAGLALYHAQHVRNARVPVAASSREQAEILHSQGEGFIERSDYLVQQGFRAQSGYRRILCYPMGSKIQVFSADDRTGDGVIPTLCVVDELHRHHNMRLYRTWQGKLDKRGGQLIAISTAGEPESEFEVARQSIRDRAVVVDQTETYLHAISRTIALHEWAVPVTADISNLAIVKAANPFTGITLQQLQDKRDSPTMTDVHYRRFVCNQAMRGELASISGIEWQEARTLETIPVGEPIFLGLDIAWKLDCTAAVPLYVRPMTDDEAARAGQPPRVVVTEDDDIEVAPERPQNIHLLGDAEILTPPRDGTSLDPDVVEQMLRDIHDRNPLKAVVMDPAKAEQLAVWIAREFGATVIERQQTNTFKTVDHDRFMEGLREGWLRHTDDEGLTRHVLRAVDHLLQNGKTVFERPSTSRRSAELQDQRVIDALTAAAMVNAYAYAENSEPEDYEPMIYLGS